MSQAVRRILIIGGGFSGMSAAIQLRKQGVEVDLVEIDPGWRSYGAGISLGGATLRAFRTIGILDEFLEQGSAADGVVLCLPHGPQIAELPTPRIAGPDVPGGGAIMRPVLAAHPRRRDARLRRHGASGLHLHRHPVRRRRRRGRLHRRPARALRPRDRRRRPVFEGPRDGVSGRAEAALQRPGRLAGRAADAAGDQDRDDVDGPEDQARRQSGVEDRDVPVRHRAAAGQRTRRPGEVPRAAARPARAISRRRCCSPSARRSTRTRRSSSARSRAC